ncbi:hypothetical protein BGZ54_010447 [Gamsiella multidivaricata]|nr:hypothetical protein BGZ54_010447 [Gamsiella multidivaricata]
MSIILPHNPLELRNPYSVLLEPEQQDSTTDICHVYTASKALLIRAMSDDDFDRLSVSSWSVVNSTYASDDDDDDMVNDEIYIDVSASHLAPLTVSALSDGFTNISKTMTAASINSSIAVSARPDTWVVKVSKKQRQGPSSQHRRPKTSTATAPSLYDVVEGGSEEEKSDEEEVYMDMTEHELSKSAKAVNLKNVRLATAHDRELCKALRLTSLPKRPRRKN